MTIARFLSGYFWLIALAIALVNHFLAMRRIERSRERPEVVAAARRFLPVMTGLQVVMWGVMGMGVVSGSTRSVFSFFRPQDGNPFVLFFVGFAIAVSLAHAWYVLFSDGAFVIWSFFQVTRRSSSLSFNPPVWFYRILGALNPVLIAWWIYSVTALNGKIPEF